MNMQKYLKFFPTALAQASLSKDRSTKVGALAISDDFDILSTGYNGFPRCVDDNVEARHARPMKYLYTAHAEENLVAQAARKGASLKGCTVIVTALFPCATCARLLIQAGVRRIIAPYPDANPRWEEQAHHARIMLIEAGVEVVHVNVPPIPVRITPPKGAGACAIP